jgi:hypothetical protein
MIRARKETSKNKILKLFLKCSESSTSFPNINRTNKKCIKVMWLTFYCFCLILCAIMMKNSIIEFLNYDVVTEIEVVYEMPTQFPTVTFFSLKNPKSNYSLNDFLISCHFNDFKCTADDFVSHIDTSGYVSYSFNNKINTTEESITPGKKNGLQIELFSGFFDDMNLTDKSILRYFRLDGFSIVVHNGTMDPRYYGGVSFDGIEISPGFSTNIIVNRIFTYKLEEPYNDCLKNLDHIDSFHSDIYKLMLNKNKYKYRQKDCFDYCVAKQFINKCQLSFELENYIILLDQNWHHLGNNETILKCLNEVYTYLVNGKLYEVCHEVCPQECDSISYEYSTK